MLNDDLESIRLSLMQALYDLHDLEGSLLRAGYHVTAHNLQHDLSGIIDDIELLERDLQ